MLYYKQSAKHRKEIFKKLKEELTKDKSKTTIYPITKLGLVQMTRQRVEESWDKAYFDDCPRCQGSGRIKSVTTITTELINQLKLFLSRNREVNPLVKANTKIIDALIKENGFEELEKKYNSEISYLKDDNFDLEQYEIASRE